MTSVERSAFLKLFNRGGYVLDFSTNSFDIFTMESIGIPICEKYGLSKGASLTAYCSEAPEGNVTKLLGELLEYKQDMIDSITAALPDLCDEYVELVHRFEMNLREGSIK